MKRYNESTPLEDRDEYQAWQKERDEEEKKSAAEKFAPELRARSVEKNKPIFEAWRALVEDIMDTIGDYTYTDLKGFWEFLDYHQRLEEEPYLCQTGYFDSCSFTAYGFDYTDSDTSGIGIEVYYNDQNPAGGDVYEEFILKLKKAGGAELCIACAVACDEDLSGLKSENQMMNLFTKSLLNGKNKVDRSTAAGITKIFKDAINGEADRYFPGADSVGFYGLENDRPTIMVTYSVDVTPTKEQIKNISEGVEFLNSNIMYPLI